MAIIHIGIVQKFSSKLNTHSPFTFHSTWCVYIVFCLSVLFVLDF